VLTRITNLFRNLVIYGLGDVATSLVSLFLLPIFTRYLTPEDYGVVTMLLTVEAVTKVVFRWGVDTAFMRLYHDCVDRPARQLLASTIFLFLIAVNGSLTLGGVLSAGWLSGWLIGPTHQSVLVALTIANTFVAGFYFIPYQVLRIGERSTQYISLTFTRSALTIVARLALVIWAGMGVLGIVLADVIVTAVFTIILTKWFAPLIRPVFSRDVLREALRFGLPRVPHSVAQQVISVSDRYFLKAYGTLTDVGLYSIGASFGLALKLFLSAFETAWTPFFLAVMREPDAKQTYRIVSTYVVAVLVLLVAGLCALAPDVVRLFTTPKFHEAASVTPWIALGVMFQGLYLVGSIGLVITKRTSFYPIATGIAAVASLAANRILIPQFGMLGAAWANVIAYATLAGVTSVFSWRVYPIQYEWSRLLRIAVAGVAAFLAASRIVPPGLRPIFALLLRAAIAVPAYAAVLYVIGFFHPGELKLVGDIRRRALSRQPMPEPSSSTDVEMGGEIVSAAPEISEPPVNPDSQAPRR
jgi:O-antigen/teichoic acid export membrane protein